MNLQTITAAQRKQLETKCANRLNWTDGGHWIGRGKAPNCFVRQKSTSTKSHTYKFPTDESATRWNMEWEKTIRQAGHFGTALLTVGVTVATSGFGGMAIGTLAAIAKDELQAQIPYPRMARGWTYELIFTHEFSYSPHPYMARILTQTITTITKDFKGNVINTSKHSSQHALKDLPDGLGRMLATAPSTKTSSNY